MAIIENFATVRYTSGGVTETTVSNLAQINLTSSVSLSKLPLGAVYGNDSLLTYILTVQNTSDAPLSGVVIEDNLGSFPYGAGELTPLTYGGSAILLVNGEDDTSALVVDATDPSVLTFSLPPLAANSIANVIYTARVNEFAPLEAGATIVNRSTLTADAECADGSADATVTVEEGASLSVFKQMCPNPVVCGGTVTYSIRVSNYGNAPATDVQLTDVFDPAPTIQSITRNGVPLVATEYTYENGVLTILAGSATGDTIPAATFQRDAQTGAVTVSPGVVEYVIKGTI